jgi:hypothetical protein
VGNLLLMRNFHRHEKDAGTLDASWYFSEIRHDSGSGAGWHKHVNIEADFPANRAIHHRFFDSRSWVDPKFPTLKRDIRRFVQRQCLGDVVVTDKNLSYEYLHELEEKYRVSKYGNHWRRGKVGHGYKLFYFEEPDDAPLFELKFAGFVTEISPRHPDREIPEEWIENAEREPWKGEREIGYGY